MLLRVVQGNALLQVATGRDKLAKMEQGLSQGTVPLQEERRVALALCQGEELFGQLTGASEVPPYQIKPEEATQHREELTGVSQPLAQGPRSGVDVFDFWGGKALGGQERCSQGELQCRVLAGHARRCPGGA